MKILIYGINYVPELTGIGKYSGEMAEWLAENGHEVRVVTAPPYYPEWRVAPGYSAWRYSRETRAGVSIWRTPLWVPHEPEVWRACCICFHSPSRPCQSCCDRLDGSRTW